jgi:hypothetical protein
MKERLYRMIRFAVSQALDFQSTIQRIEVPKYLRQRKEAQQSIINLISMEERGLG